MTPRLLLSLCAAAVFSAIASPPHNSPGSHWNKGRGYLPFRHATSDAIEINNQTPEVDSDGISLPDTLSRFSITFRAANLSFHPSRRFTYTDTSGIRRHRKNPEWSFWIADTNADTISFTVYTEEIPDPISSSAAILIKANSNEGSISQSATLTDGIDCFSGVNIWKATADGRQIHISAGNHGLKPVMTIPCESFRLSGFGFSASPAAHIRISDISLSDESTQALHPHPEWKHSERIREHLDESNDPLEGYWTIYDRSLEETLLTLGGDYRLAIIKEGDRYLIIYLSGARTNAGVWQPGMIKGILTPDPFPATYSVTWFDAEGKPLYKDIKAQTGEGETLLIQFPYQSSALRLRRL